MNLRAVGSILLYGLCLGALLALLTWSRYRFTVVETNLELYALLLAAVFAALGAWLGTRLMRPAPVIRKEIVIREIAVPVPVAAPAEAPPAAVPAEALGISQRELDVLRELARGLSNEEIAAALFVSANTVKTHLSNLYFKLDVRRRTQAVEKARQLGLLS